MFELINKILGLFEKLFGKTMEDLGNRIHLYYLNKLDPKNNPYVKLLNLPYVRYGEGSCYYGKCFKLKNRDELLRKQEYQKYYNSINYFKRKSLIKKIIRDFQINCYDNCDKFLITIIVLFKNITKKDIVKIFEKEKDNNQSLGGIMALFGEIKEIKPKLLSDDIKKYLEAWKKIN